MDVCLLTDLLDSEIRLGHDALSTTPPLRIADKWHCCQWVGWRLTDDVVLMEISHADFSIRFTSVLEPSTDRLVRMAGLLQGTLSPQILDPQCLASAEHRMVVHLTTLQIRTVSDWLVRRELAS